MKTEYEALLAKMAEEAGSPIEVTHTHAHALLGSVGMEREAQEIGAHVTRLWEESQVWEGPSPKGRASLVVINHQGGDGERLWVPEEGLVIGREADMSYPEDEFISPEHARLKWQGGGLYLRDLESLNGTYIKVREALELRHGDMFLMGRQVLRFVNLTSEREENEREETSTRVMGSPAPSNVYALKQMGIGDEVYDMRHLGASPVRLGRDPVPQEGEETFGFEEDIFMSSTHARVVPRDGGWYLEDLDSGNGTWIQIRDTHRLKHEDHLFLGKQLLRLEYTEETER